MLNGSNAFVKGRWKLVKKIGQGAFGEIYSGYDVITKEQVAVKFERVDSRKQVLKLEMAVLKKLQACPHVCRFVHCGRHTEYNYLVMELLSENISELRKRQPEGKFSLSTALRLGMQMLKAIEAVHELGYLHRDIKPSNFAMGLNSRHRKCFLIDFGLARRYRLPTGEVRPARESTGFRGTARYASIHSHSAKDLGRRDDLWSLLYVLIEFIMGYLPWRKVKDKDQIGELKVKWNTPELVKNLPDEFKFFMDHLKSLDYHDRPDYQLLHNLLESLFIRHMASTQNTIINLGFVVSELDLSYDWELPQQSPPLQSPTRISTFTASPSSTKDVNEYSLGNSPILHIPEVKNEAGSEGAYSMPAQPRSVPIKPPRRRDSKDIDAFIAPKILVSRGSNEELKFEDKHIRDKKPKDECWSAPGLGPPSANAPPSMSTTVFLLAQGPYPNGDPDDDNTRATIPTPIPSVDFSPISNGTPESIHKKSPPASLPSVENHNPSQHNVNDESEEDDPNQKEKGSSNESSRAGGDAQVSTAATHSNRGSSIFGSLITSELDGGSFLTRDRSFGDLSKIRHKRARTLSAGAVPLNTNYDNNAQQPLEINADKNIPKAGFLSSMNGGEIVNNRHSTPPVLHFDITVDKPIQFQQDINNPQPPKIKKKLPITQPNTKKYSKNSKPCCLIL